MALIKSNYNLRNSGVKRGREIFELTNADTEQFGNSVKSARKESYNDPDNFFKNNASFNSVVNCIMHGIHLPSANVLILDNDDCRTSNYFINEGVKKENILTIEYIKDTHLKHLKFGVKSIHDDAGNVFSNPNKWCKFDAIHLDLQCNVDTIMKQDYIDNLFRNKYINTVTSVFITAAKRSNIKGAYFVEDFKFLQDYTQQIADAYGYKCEIDHELTQDQSYVASFICVFKKKMYFELLD